MAALWIGLSFSEKRASRYKISASTLNNLVLTISLAYLIGGRFFYAFEHISAFVQSPISLISLNIALFDNFGALTVTILAGLVYVQRQRLSLWSTLDTLTLLFSWMVLGLGLSHLATGAAFGQETDLPWAIYLWGAMRHPTQFYEIGASLLILFLIWIRKPSPKPGSDFLLFIALISVSRLVIEAFRGDSTLVLGGLRLAQILAWLALTISLIGLELLKPKESGLLPESQDIRLNKAVTQSGTSKKSRKVSLKKSRRDTKTDSTKTNIRTHHTQ